MKPGPLASIPRSAPFLRVIRRLRLPLGALALTMSAACATGKALPQQAVDSSGGRLFNGYGKSDVKCFSCHNGDASGANGPSLADRVPKLTDEQIIDAMNRGPKYMPSFKDKLTEEEKREIVAWLRTRFPSR
jgi:mono/diheme cytochrome c family protein